MNSVQFAWIVIGVMTGLAMILPIRRCMATHNGLLSMLTASLMGIFTVSFSWVPVVLAAVFFTYGFYQNHHKYFGVTNDSTKRT